MLHKANQTSFKKGQIPWNAGTGIPKEGDKECPVCHKIFHYKRSSSNPAPKTCSKECRYKSCSINGIGRINKGTIRVDRKIKKRAERFVRMAVDRGVLIKTPCEFCGEKETQGHHYLGYSPENWLKVKWLCKKCHYEEHKRLRRTGESSLL